MQRTALSAAADADRYTRGPQISPVALEHPIKVVTEPPGFPRTQENYLGLRVVAGGAKAREAVQRSPHECRQKCKNRPLEGTK